MNKPNVGMMRIAVDQNIPQAQEALAGLGDVRLFDGRKLQKSDLLETDVLWVRSVTKVNADLLAGTPVRYVGTATAGVNHIDANWLNERGIQWDSAPGSNAISVGDYICSALAVLEQRGKIRNGMKVAILGHGHVGRVVAPRLRALGFEVVVYDPLRKPFFLEEDLCELEEIFDADILSLHIPLTFDGPYATHRWIDRHFLSRFKPGLVFMNAARGEVVVQDDLISMASQGFFGGLVLDVFEKEPNVPTELFELADLLTPHIAGYSWTGKLRGTAMLRHSLLNWLGHAASDEHTVRHLEQLKASDIWSLILSAYDVQKDDAIFRVACAESGSADLVFDHLRKTYPKRLEFSDYQVVSIAGKKSVLEELGFEVIKAPFSGLKND